MAKIIQIGKMFAQVTAKNVGGVFWDTVYTEQKKLLQYGQ